MQRTYAVLELHFTWEEKRVGKDDGGEKDKGTVKIDGWKRNAEVQSYYQPLIH